MKNLKLGKKFAPIALTGTLVIMVVLLRKMKLI